MGLKALTQPVTSLKLLRKMEFRKISRRMCKNGVELFGRLYLYKGSPNEDFSSKVEHKVISLSFKICPERRAMLITLILLWLFFHSLIHERAPVVITKLWHHFQQVCWSQPKPTNYGLVSWVETYIWAQKADDREGRPGEKRPQSLLA